MHDLVSCLFFFLRVQEQLKKVQELLEKATREKEHAERMLKEAIEEKRKDSGS